MKLERIALIEKFGVFVQVLISCLHPYVNDIFDQILKKLIDFAIKIY